MRDEREAMTTIERPRFLNVGSTPESEGADPGVLWWAWRAFRKEVLDFRFDYPIERVPAAADVSSLHYHIYSDRLFFDAMRLDDAGIPLLVSRTVGAVRLPAYVAWYGLVSLEQSLRGCGPSDRETFLRQARWLADNAVERDDGSIVWHHPFDWYEGECFLRAPWISAMAQGLAISALVRAHRLEPLDRWIDIARGAIRVFGQDVQEGGVRTVERGHILYEEYPGYPLARVLDGFLFSLLGLYDLHAETGDELAGRRFREGMDGLSQHISVWDHRGLWSWYGDRRYLSPIHYHKLNGVLLAALAELTGNAALRDVARAWDPSRLTLRDRTEIMIAFLFTKNRSRLRHWRSR